MKTLLSALSLVALLALWGCASSDTNTLTAQDLARIQESAQKAYQSLGSAPKQQAPQAPAAPTAADEQYYPIDQMERWVAVVLDRGARVKLNDNSVWEISRTYQSQTMNWSVSEKILVTKNPDTDYPFTLLNNTKKLSVNARLLSTK